MRIFIWRVFIWAVALVAVLSVASLAQNPSLRPGQAEGTASITGRITLSGKPAPNVVVTLTPFNSDPQRMFYQIITRSAVMKVTSDEEGRYRFANVPAGHYQLSMFAPAYINTGANKVITIAEGETLDGNDFSLTRGGVITGRVTGPNGQPLIGVKIDLFLLKQDGQKQPMGGDEQGFLTDDRGVYRAYGLPAGRYIVGVGQNSRDLTSMMFKRRAYASTYHPDVTDDAKAVAVEVKEGVEATAIDIKVGDATRTFKASGRVIDADTGKPIADVVPFFLPDERAMKSVGSSGTGSPTNTGGEFFLEGLVPGNYKATARFLLQESSEYYSEETSFEVTTQDVRGVEIKMRRGAAINGTVILEAAGEPELAAQLSQAKIYALVMGADNSPRGFAQSAITAGGGFQLRGLPPGKARLKIEDMSESVEFSIHRVERNGADAQSGIEVASGEQVNGVTVFLSQANGVIRGTVTVQGGTLARGTYIAVTLRRIGDDLDHDMTSSDVDADGRFEFKHVAAGNFEISASIQSSDSEFLHGLDNNSKQNITMTNAGITEVNLVINLKAKDKDKDR